MAFLQSGQGLQDPNQFLQQMLQHLGLGGPLGGPGGPNGVPNLLNQPQQLNQPPQVARTLGGPMKGSPFSAPSAYAQVGLSGPARLGF